MRQFLHDIRISFCLTTILVFAGVFVFASPSNDSITSFDKPTAAFKINSNTQCASNNQFIFSNTSVSTCGCLKSVWTFGDGTSDTAYNPKKIYASPGFYNVTLRVTDDLGLKDSLTVQVQVFAPPTASFTVNPTLIQCLNGNHFIFTNTSNSYYSGITYSWDLGNGTTSAETNPQISYAAAGNYTVKLTASYQNICPATKSITLTVNPTPKADFTYQTNNATRTVNFTNQSSISSGSLNYNWAFGDGDGDVVTNPSKTYAKDGLYNVSLIASAATSGCSDYSLKTVLIGTKPAAGFTVGVGVQCITGNNFVFTNTSVTNGTNTYLWNFGDGSTSTATNPKKTYSVIGDYVVMLIATNTTTGEKDTSKSTVSVWGEPTAAFMVSPGSPYCLNTTNHFNFTNQSTNPYGGTVNYQWDCGDGRIVNGNNIANDYNSAGSYTIQLTATATNGCSSVATQTINVYDRPSVNFTATADPANYKNVTFTNASNIKNGSIANYNWSFGDNHSSTDVSPVHNYSSDNTYSVTLTATSDHGCTGTITKPVVIKDSLYAFAEIGNSCQCADINSFHFVGYALGSYGNYTYAWDFKDGTSSTIQYPIKKYTTPGDYYVSLTVKNDHGGTATGTTLVRVYPKPKAGFNIVADQQSSAKFTFTNTSAISNGTVTYGWDFGDGTTSTETNPTKTYSQPGVYQVKLTATSDLGGCADTVSHTINIGSGGGGGGTCSMVANFSVNNLTQCVTGNQFVFTSNITGGTAPYKYSWDLNDGTYSTAQNVTKSYSTYSEHDVSLMVTDSKGCTSNAVQQIYVGCVPAASFKVLNPTYNGSGYTLISTSTIAMGSMNYYWDLGDGTSSTLVNPTVVYQPGYYTVKLVVSGVGTCKDSVSQVIKVASGVAGSSPLTADFTYARNGCTNSAEAFIFTNKTTGGVAPYHYAWDFGDGTTSTQANPTHYYLYANNYNITLKVTDANNTVVTKTVTVQSQGGAKPTASFDIYSNTQNGNSYTFVSTSTISSGWMNYYWDLGNGTTSTLINPTITYTSKATYTIKLVVTGSSGCKDSITKSVTVSTINSVNSGTGNIIPPVDVTPNPTNNTTAITFRSSSIEKTTISIVNGLGQIVKQQVVYPAAANVQITSLINITSLKNGFYFVTVTDSQNKKIGFGSILKN